MPPKGVLLMKMEESAGDDGGEDVKNICLKQCFKFKVEPSEQGELLLNDLDREPAHPDAFYECRFCRKRFTSDTHLKRHSDTVHSSERRFFCSICKTGFTRHEHLKRHVLTHYNERPYKCEYCTKAFARKEYLKRHEMIHSGDRPWNCDFCESRFYRKDHLAKHINRIHKKTVQPG